MATGNLYQLTVTGAIAGQFAQNVLHYQYVPVGTPDPFIAAAAITSEWISTVKAAWLDALPDSYAMSSIRCAQVSAPGGATFTQTSGVGGETGSRDTEISVSTIGPILAFPVTLSRQTVGKIFLPGVAEDDISMGHLVPGLQTELNTLIGALLTQLTPSGSAPGTADYCVASADKSNWAKPVGGYISATIGTQRRRAKPLY